MKLPIKTATIQKASLSSIPQPVTPTNECEVCKDRYRSSGFVFTGYKNYGWQ